jgi:hypothetical protein
MFETDQFSTGFSAGFSIECGTCLASGTTACSDCIVTHLLANDDGPIDLTTVSVDFPLDPQEQAIALFERSGLLDDPVEFVPFDVFESLAPAGAHAV